MYNNIAPLYDQLNDDVQYEKWVDYIQDIFSRYDCNPQVFLELGCGTGSFALMMAKKGYMPMCLDISEDMLAVAKDKADREKQEIMFLQQDMTDFKLTSKPGAIVCLLDTFNHITNKNKAENMIRKCYHHLKTGGLFIFDINTIYKLQNIFSDEVFYVDEEDFTCVWQCNYLQDNCLSRIELTLFKKEDNVYKRYDETIIERGYEINEIKTMCEQAGFDCMGVFNEFSFEQYSKNSERVFFVCKKNMR